MRNLALFSFLAFLFIFLGRAPQGEAAEFHYVGTEGCKCHKSEISDWERSKHAQAYELLMPGKQKSKKKKAGLDPDKDYSNDEKCLPCHVTGLKKPGGFRDSASTPAMAGVGCESCHGAGSEYRGLHKDKSLTFTRDEAKEMGALYGSVDPKVCDTCHSHADNPFTAKIDAKYNFDHGAALKENRSFHDFYALDGKH